VSNYILIEIQSNVRAPVLKVRKVENGNNNDSFAVTHRVRVYIRISRKADGGLEVHFVEVEQRRLQFKNVMSQV